MPDYPRLPYTDQSDLAAPDSYAARVAQLESSGNPRAWTNGSKYRGLYQLGPDEEKQWGVTDWTDPDQQRKALNGIWTRNAAHFRNAMGRDPTEPEQYLMHQQGPAGLTALLQNPDASAADTVGKWGNGLKKIGGNLPSSWGLDPAAATGRQFTDAWTARYNRASPDAIPRPPGDIQARSQPTQQRERTPMADATQEADQGALSGLGQGWNAMQPALERAGAYLMSINNPSVLGHIAEMDKSRRANWGVTGENQWSGAKTYGWIDPNKQTINGQRLGPAAAGVNGLPQQGGPDEVAASIKAIQARGGSVEDQLKTLPSNYQEAVKAAGEYKLDPTKLAGRGKEHDNVMNLAAQIYGPQGWSMSDYGGRYKYARDFANAGNMDSKAITSGQKSLNHLGTYSEQAADLGQATAPIAGLQPLVSGVQSAFGDPNDPNSFNAKSKGLDMTADALSGEIKKLFTGASGGGEREREYVRGLLSSATTPAARQKVIETVREMVNGQLDVYRGKRNDLFQGTDPAELDKRYRIGGTDVDTARIEAALGKMRGGGGSSAAAPTEQAPMPGARKAPDGHWYVQQNGKYFRID